MGSKRMGGTQNFFIYYKKGSTKNCRNYRPIKLLDSARTFNEWTHWHN